MNSWTLPSLVVFASALWSCKTLRNSTQAPEPYRDQALAAILDDFVEDAKAHGKIIGRDKLGKLRVMAFTADVDGKRQGLGLSDGGHRDTAGACNDAKVTNKIGDGALEYRLSESAWQEIWIRDEFARKGKSWQLRELVYHELGHCLLGLDHQAEKPHRIMSPTIHDEGAWISKNWDRLVGELFAPR